MTQTPEASSLQAAVELHQSGQIDKAAKAYERILESRPDDPNALHLLGVTFVQRGRHDKATGLIERAIALRPNVGVYHVNLASAYRALRRVDDTIEQAEKAIALDPKLASRGYHIAGLAFGDAGQLEDAAFCLERSVQADPEFGEAQLMLAIVLDRLDRIAEAFPPFDRAKEIVKRWLDRDPQSGQAHVLAAQIARQEGRLDDAVGSFRTATRLMPYEPSVFYWLGQVLQHQGKRDEAFTCFNLALRLNPSYTDAHVAVGAVLDRQYRPLKAVESFRTALSLAPRHGEAMGFLASALTHCGRIDEAIEAGRRAIELNPGSASIGSVLLLTLHYSPKVTPQQMFQEHLDWSRRHAARFTESVIPHQNSLDPERKLVVGFISSDFRKHPVAKYILPVLENHDKERFAFVCYSDTETTDELTDRIRAAASGWKRIVTWTDARVASQIRDDKVDILIDLAAHTGDADRLLTFARKPAPIQMTVFGYPDTTGLSTVDYRITDDFSDPPGASESLHTEKLARLPGGAYCYRPFERESRIEVRPPSEPVAFGSANNMAKLSDITLSTWAALLRAAPNTRLVVLATSSEIEQTRDTLVRHGIAPAQLTVLERVPADRYFSVFNQFDIALDPFPYNGGVTTCDALWMGVPVVALAGQTYASRQGMNLLNRVGLGDLVAATTDDYVRIGAALAADRGRLTDLRFKLREMMLASPICDYAGYTQNLQDLFRTSWRQYCGDCDARQQG